MGVRMEKTGIYDKHRAYRERIAANGNHQLVLALPRETVAFLDELQKRRGLRNRSQAVLQLIERGREVTQQ
jgi:metal-responsive CopG/Arc/MetJ family transcriptional regulator